MGPNCSLFARVEGGGGPPPTVANCSEGPANWAPGAGGHDERVPIALVHESLVMSLRDQTISVGSRKWTAVPPGPGNDPSPPDLLYLIVKVSWLVLVSQTGSLVHRLPEASQQLGVRPFLVRRFRHSDAQATNRVPHFAGHRRQSLALGSASPLCCCVGEISAGVAD